MKKSLFIGCLTTILFIVSSCLSQQSEPEPLDNCVYKPSFIEANSSNEDVTEVNFELIRRIDTEHNNFAQDIAFQPNSNYLAGSMGGNITIWDTNTGETIETIEVASERLGRVTFSPDGLMLAGIVDRHVEVLNVATKERLLQTPRYEPNDIVFIDNDRLAISQDEELQIWSLAEGSLLTFLEFPDMKADEISLNATHTCLIVEEVTRHGSDNESRLTLIDLTTFERQRIYSGLPSGGLSFCPNSNLIAYAQIGHVSLIDTVSFEEQFSIEQGAQPVRFHPEKPILLTTNFSTNFDNFANQVIVWELNNHEILSVLAHDSRILDMDFNTDGSLLAVLTGDGIHIWDSAD